MVAKFSALKVIQKKKKKNASRLPLALAQEIAQEKAGNTLENLLNEIRQMIYSFYRAREITKKGL